MFAWLAWFECRVVVKPVLGCLLARLALYLCFMGHARIICIAVGGLFERAVTKSSYTGADRRMVSCDEQNID